MGQSLCGRKIPATYLKKTTYSLTLSGFLDRHPHLHPAPLHRPHNPNLLPPHPHQHRLPDRFRRRPIPVRRLLLLLLPNRLRPPPLPPSHSQHQTPTHRWPNSNPRRRGCRSHLGTMARARCPRHLQQPVRLRLSGDCHFLQLLAGCDADYGCDDEL